MKTGDKVYCISKQHDVIVTDIENQIVGIYDDTDISYGKTRKSDLLEYEQQSHSIQGARTICTTAPRTTEYGQLTPVQQNKTEKEGLKMNVKKLFGEFGKVQAGEVAFTFDGKVAVRRNADEYVRYNTEKGQIENHMGLVIKEASKLAFILPVVSISEDDVIKFKGKFYQVLAVAENGSVSAINLTDGTKSTICKETNAFGINFYYKVTSLFGGFTPATDGTTPAPAIDPMMLMLLSKDGSSDFSELLPLLLMGQGNAGLAQNPLLMMSLLGDGGFGGDMKDIFLMQALAGGQQGTAFNPLLLLALQK